jgi:hypothetical protein
VKKFIYPERHAVVRVKRLREGDSLAKTCCAPSMPS